MSLYLPVVGLLAFLFSLCRIFGFEAIDFDAPRIEHDNFLEAQFRFVMPDGLDHNPQCILVIVPGTDGDAREWSLRPEFLETARKCNAVLIACYYRGEGLGYDLPSGGSGRALDDAIAYFSEKIGQPGLISAPLMIWGHSMGAQFAFNYACWKPERLAAFASIKAGSFQLNPQDASYSVPGVIAVGEWDDPGRIRNGSAGFLQAKGRHAKWAFLNEGGSGHEPGRSDLLVRAFFEAVCNPSSAAWADLENGSLLKDSSLEIDPGCWFPSEQVAELWRSIHKPVPLHDLLLTPDRPSLSELLEIEGLPDRFQASKGVQQGIDVQLIPHTDKQIQITRIGVVGQGFSWKNRSEEFSLPIAGTITFQPEGMHWGPVHGVLSIDARIDGQPGESLQIDLHGLVVGAINAAPSAVYMGIVDPNQEIERVISLNSNGPFTIKAVRSLSDSGITCQVVADEAGAT